MLPLFFAVDFDGLLTEGSSEQREEVLLMLTKVVPIGQFVAASGEPPETRIEAGCDAPTWTEYLGGEWIDLACQLQRFAGLRQS
jgi:hypothetical protein